MTKIVSVLKQGPEYGVKEAQFLHNQLKGYDAVCLSDITIPGVETHALEHHWPGWWSKLELFNPTGPLAGQDLLYLDIDTLVTGNLTDLIEECQERDEMVMLTDFYNEHLTHAPPASGVMYIPNHIKAQIWNAFLEYGPDNAMRDFTRPPRGGDQGFIGSIVPDVSRWQDLFPRQILSYKKDIACRGMEGFHNQRSKGDGTIPAETHVVCFHGKPRPWQVNWQALLENRS